MSQNDSTDQSDVPKATPAKEKPAAASAKAKKIADGVSVSDVDKPPAKKRPRAKKKIVETAEAGEKSFEAKAKKPRESKKEETSESSSKKEGSDSASNSDDSPSAARSDGDGRDGRDGRRNSRQRSSRKNGGRRGNNRRRRPEGSDGNPRSENPDNESEGGVSGDENSENRPHQKTRKQRYQERKEKERAREADALEAAPAIESEGIVEISSKGFGFLRENKRGFQQSPKDVFITPEIVRTHGLRDGLMVKCVSKEGLRGPQLIELVSINNASPEEYALLPYFEELTAINPNKKLTLETDSTRATTRVIDLVAPIGRGQRGLIVAPPRTGKTTLLHHIAEGIQKNYDDEIHLMVLLVDERPEEVTDFQRSFSGVEIFSSSNDSEAKDHARIALLAIERAKRLVEAGQHVVMLMDSITRLARAFNSQIRGGKGRGTASGGLTVGALEVPRRIFAAARNTREAGSLTIIATALIQTNSKADEAIFQEFKGTGNMELVLDRQIAQNYVYPAVDIHKSGTRREELLLPPHVLEKIYVIRRGLGGYKPVDAMEWLLKCMERYPSNAQMLMDIKTTALA
ncbi:transcription termination factor Rho [Verrucomicrobiales bacterium]|nr:transcription termination factor Rho [Verrucomicrobiales bacterium]